MSKAGKLANKIRATVLGIILAVSAAPAPASAHAPLLLSLQISQAMVLAIQAGGMCVSYVYDANGNRTNQTVATVGSGPTLWGSGTYGCFLWSA